MTTLTLANPFVRMLSILPAASIATLLILYLMHQLVHTDFVDIVEPEDTEEITAFINEDPTDIKDRYEELEKPVKPQPPTTPPEAPEPDPVDPHVSKSTDGLLTGSKPVIEVTLNSSFGDQAMPFIKVQPNYPTSASSRGIEGYVDVIFDVAPTGATENIRIIHAVPSSIFNSSVVQAIKRWKYKPRMVNDAPVKSFDVRERITFELEKG
ncbi:MAG TPA: TonB family protein [Cellvibrio sp.]|nr:TonB family protein [Cellvibrio sp.]